MTIPRRDGGDTPFSAWIRNQPELDSKRGGYDLEDIDRMHTCQYFWHQYIQAHIMIIEEKQYNRIPTDAQFDTLGVINQALQHAFGDPDFHAKRQFRGRPTEYTYFGYHLIQFEKTGPHDGGIRINYKPVTEKELLRFLQFDKAFIQEKLRVNPLTIPVNVPLLSKPKRGLRKGDRPILPNLFDSDPIHQQPLWFN